MKTKPVCAWCNPPERPDRNAGRIPTSHGICHRHAVKLLQELGLTIKQEGEFKQMVTKTKGTPCANS